MSNIHRLPHADTPIRERHIAADEYVLSRWFESLLDDGMGIQDALTHIAVNYPDHEIPLGDMNRWNAFCAWQSA